MKTIASTHVIIHPGSNIYLVAAELIGLARKVDGTVTAVFANEESAMQISVNPDADVPSVVLAYQGSNHGKETT